MSDKPSCDLHIFQRNKYFYGKLMSVRDFEAEQDYINGKRHLLHRVLHGPGIVCGLTDPTVSTTPDGKARITFITGGVALDCCGREIVIPDGTIEPITDGQGNELTSAVLSGVTGPIYLYLRYSEGPGELVAAASNPSSCDETCCPNRIIEDFQVLWTTTKPAAPALLCPDLSGNIDSTTVRNRIRDWIREQSKTCPPCDDLRVFLGAVNKDLTPNPSETKAYVTYVASHRELTDLLKCHLSDFTNPHQTSAQQTGALVSVDGVTNPGGNVDLVAANKITITPNNGAPKTITIGETHSGQTGNPHSTKHAELQEVLPVDPTKTDETRDKHISNKDANRWNGAILKINGVAPDANGGFTVEGGDNVSVIPGANRVTISSTGGTECLTGLLVFRDIGAGATKYSQPIELVKYGKAIFGIIMGVEYEITLGPGKARFIVTGDAVKDNGVALTSRFDMDSFELTVMLSNLTKEVIKECKVRWWAIAHTRDTGTVVVKEETPMGPKNLLADIAARPNISLKALSERYGTAGPELEEQIKLLVENGAIEVRGSGSDRTFRVRTT